ncbi:MAG: CDP-alcohol phosphatidyltransferase family protein [Xenococcus sp. (in: cyanobacteria)]
MMKLTNIPSFLIGLRFAISPLLLIDALDGSISSWFLFGYIIAVISDIFDGIIARYLKVSTVKLRQADSWADICLYLCVAISVWIIYPQIIIDFQIPLFLAILAQLILFTISLIKFQKFPSFHTYTAKLWGISLLIATVALFGFDYAPTISLAIALCLINSFEEILMTLLLPEWRCDLLSLFHI